MPRQAVFPLLPLAFQLLGFLLLLLPGLTDAFFLLLPLLLFTLKGLLFLFRRPTLRLLPLLPLVLIPHQTGCCIPAKELFGFFQAGEKVLIGAAQTSDVAVDFLAFFGMLQLNAQNLIV